MHYDLTLRKNCPDSSISENHLPLFRHIKRIFDQDLLMQVGLCDTTIDASYETSKRDSLTSLPGLPGWPPATCSLNSLNWLKATKSKQTDSPPVGPTLGQATICIKPYKSVFH